MRAKRCLLLALAASCCILLSVSILQNPISIHNSLPHEQISLLPSHPKSTLESLLLEIAPQKEILITLSDSYFFNGNGVLQLWLEGVLQSNVTNYLVMATDVELYHLLRRQGIHVFLFTRHVPAQNGTGANHEISSMKYQILSEILLLGWNALLSDADVVTLQNPFDGHLHRDADIEAMSDGTEETTAYGEIVFFDDPSMGWSRYAQGIQHYNLNSGLFYIKANSETHALMVQMAKRLSKEQYWDQQAFNEEIFFLSHGKYRSPNVTVRVMEIHAFMNSKTFFKYVVNDVVRSKRTPVMVHVNYHPDKHDRMKTIMNFYKGSSENRTENESYATPVQT